VPRFRSMSPTKGTIEMIGVRFVGVVIKSPGSDYGVHFPDLPGCITAGKTMADARSLAAEALRLHLDDMVQDGTPIPVARSLTDIRDDPECQGATTLILVEAAAPAKAN
jgi:predicted RNase H-like HicB family nuclease